MSDQVSQTTPTGFSPQNAARVARATLLVERQNRMTETADYGTPVKDGGGAGLTQKGNVFAVLTKRNGNDADGNPMYDVYTLADTGFATKLNTGGPLSPVCSRARTIDMVVGAGAVIAAEDGGLGADAFYGADGAIVLRDLPEKNCGGT